MKKKSTKFRVRRHLRRKERHAVKRALCDHDSSRPGDSFIDYKPVPTQGAFIAFDTPNRHLSILAPRPAAIARKFGKQNWKESGE